MSSRSLIVVNYRTSSLALDAIRSARAASSEPLQVIVVDNSENAAEAEALRAACDVLLVPPRNLGYAAAINLARRSCDGDLLIVSNPDVVFGQNAIDLLDEANVPVAGPALFWDSGFEWILPPSDLYTTAERFDAALASRLRMWAGARDRRRFRRRLNFWSLTNTTRVDAISGAVMAIRATHFSAFDERFFLYFEETDFIRRAGEACYVPQAKCRHIYNQSAADSIDAARYYTESERKYLEKWSGTIATRVIKAMERPPRLASPDFSDDLITIDRDDVIVEASPLVMFDTAAGHFPKRGAVDVPAEVWRAYRAEALYLRVVERGSGAVLATYARRRIRP